MKNAFKLFAQFECICTATKGTRSLLRLVALLSVFVLLRAAPAQAQSPVIVTQPVDRTRVAGQTANFSVAATGTLPLTYQWTKNGADITGAIHASYTTPATTEADNGALFAVTVSNSIGTAVSATAVLTVVTAPFITEQPVSETVTEGKTATFAVTAIGIAPLLYQWAMNNANIPGANAAFYTTPATAAVDNGAVFSVTVMNSAGSVTSRSVTLAVQPAPAPTPTATTSLNPAADKPRVYCHGGKSRLLGDNR